MGIRCVRLGTLLAATSLCFSCGSDRVSPATRGLIEQAHLRMLTLDADAAAGAPGAKGTFRPAIYPAAMRKGGLDAVVAYISPPPLSPAPEGGPSAQEAVFEAIDALERSVAGRPELAALALAPGDAYRLEKEGRRAVYIGLVYGDGLGTDIEALAACRNRGVRFLKLCGGRDNAVCDTDLDGTDTGDRGLSGFGREVVAACNRLGLVIDAGGASARAIADTLAASRAPVICSLGAAKALCDAAGNLSGETVAAIAAAGGVVLVPFEAGRLVPAGEGRRATIEDIALHIGFLIRAAGPEAVGIGSRFGNGGGVSGLRDAADIQGLTVELLRRGVSEHVLESVWGGNVMRVFERTARLAGSR